jgi:hypothetical protein
METFVIRLWTDDDAPVADVGSNEEPAEQGLRGIVRHVRTGTETAFAGSAELIVLLSTQVPVGRLANRVETSRDAATAD